MKRTLIRWLGGKTEVNVIRNGRMFNVTRLFGREMMVDPVHTDGGYNLGYLDYDARVSRPKRVDLFKPHAVKKDENLTRKGEFL
jgi:hypothetical protein